MGHVRVSVRIGNPNRREAAVEVKNALVDKGASWTTVPRGLADQLGLEVLGRKRVTTANGTVQADQSYAFVEIEGRQTIHEVLITDAFPGVLIGVLTLEGLGFAVDPVNERLIDSELLLL
jgi:clan AA aspartic protease